MESEPFDKTERLPKEAAQMGAGILKSYQLLKGGMATTTGSSFSKKEDFQDGIIKQHNHVLRQKWKEVQKGVTGYKKKNKNGSLFLPIKRTW
ncbi:hypothetical protein CEXT_174751 [Caerostris extrusa]|uniref:Uncharacterized protein n=1 Tax=Caerostris extrusa TaxID=172846 RepID=A0AAV4XEE2_CAEEX|nr:hypothetical protein CEXT_174751 [Caerostris extrusa]